MIFLDPVLDDLRKFGGVNKPARPWLGMYTTEMDNRLVVVGIASKGPAARADLKTGDVILALNGDKVPDQTDFYRRTGRSAPQASTCRSPFTTRASPSTSC